MRLSNPTDFLILEALADGERDTGANLAKRIDRNRSYINNQLPKLADQGLIQKIGPHQNSGLYQITPLGVAAIQKQSLYSEDEDEFEVEIREVKDRIEITRPSVTIHASVTHD
jgi:DNA-binding PadR family transcriptional regulator